MPEFQEISRVNAVTCLADGVFLLEIQAPRIAITAHPGQFVMVACGQGFDPLLRRPFSIHRVTPDGTVHLLLKVVGQGARWLSQLSPGDLLDVIGPLGRGFLSPHERPIALVGGGIGIAPLLFLAERLADPASQFPPPLALLGAKTRIEILHLTAAFVQAGCEVITATDDGSHGHHGMITDLLPFHLGNVRQMFSCGPHAMMATVAQFCDEQNIPCQVSLEAHMACGLGACLGCTIQAADGGYRHVCSHGPVFQAKEVAWHN